MEFELGLQKHSSPVMPDSVANQAEQLHLRLGETLSLQEYSMKTCLLLSLGLQQCKLFLQNYIPKFSPTFLTKAKTGLPKSDLHHPC